MTYLLNVEDTSEGKSLIDFLKSLKFVELIHDSDEIVSGVELFDENGMTITKNQLEKILLDSESSKSIEIDDAFNMSELWKNKSN